MLKTSLIAAQEELDVVPALLAMLDSPVAALRAKALVCWALLMQTHPSFLLEAFQAKLTHQVHHGDASSSQDCF